MTFGKFGRGLNEISIPEASADGSNFKIESFIKSTREKDTFSKGRVPASILEAVNNLEINSCIR